MVKAYLRYEPAAAFGVIVSVESNIIFDSSGTYLLAPALEKVGVWHVRKGLCTKNLAPSPVSRGPSIAVTSIASSPSSMVTTFCYVLFPCVVFGSSESETKKTKLEKENPTERKSSSLYSVPLECEKGSPLGVLAIVLLGSKC